MRPSFRHGQRQITFLRTGQSYVDCFSTEMWPPYECPDRQPPLTRQPARASASPALTLTCETHPMRVDAARATILSVQHPQSSATREHLAGCWVPSSGAGPPGKKQRRRERGGDGEVAAAAHPQPASARSALGGAVRRAGSRSRNLNIVFLGGIHGVLEVMAAAGRVYAQTVEEHGRSRHRLGSAHTPFAARLHTGTSLWVTAQQKLEQVVEWVSCCRVASTFDKPSAVQESRSSDRLRSRWRSHHEMGPSSTGRGTWPMEGVLLPTEAPIASRRSPIQSLIRAVLVAMGCSTPVGKAPRGALARGVLRADSEKGQGKGRAKGAPPKSRALPSLSSLSQRNDSGPDKRRNAPPPPPPSPPLTMVRCSSAKFRREELCM